MWNMYLLKKMCLVYLLTKNVNLSSQLYMPTGKMVECNLYHNSYLVLQFF